MIDPTEIFLTPRLLCRVQRGVNDDATIAFAVVMRPMIKQLKELGKWR